MRTAPEDVAFARDMNRVTWALGLVLLGAIVLGLLLGLDGCGGAPSADTWTPADTTKITHAVQGGKTLVSVCRSDAGCTPGQCAFTTEQIDCNLGSALFRHGAPDLLDGGSGCVSR